MGQRKDKGTDITTITDLQEHLQFNMQLLLSAHTSFALFQKFVLFYKDEKYINFSHLLSALVDATLTNCIMCSTRLIDTREQINLCNTIKRTQILCPNSLELEPFESRISAQNERIDRLCNCRDKHYAHADIENLDKNSDIHYTLFVNDIDSILNICFDGINAVSKIVNGYVIGGYDCKNHNPKLNYTDLALCDLEKFLNVFSLHDAMLKDIRQQYQKNSN